MYLVTDSLGRKLNSIHEFPYKNMDEKRIKINYELWPIKVKYYQTLLKIK